MSTAMFVVLVLLAATATTATLVGVPLYFQHRRQKRYVEVLRAITAVRQCGDVAFCRDCDFGSVRLRPAWVHHSGFGTYQHLWTIRVKLRAGHGIPELSLDGYRGGARLLYSVKPDKLESVPHELSARFRSAAPTTTQLYLGDRNRTAALLRLDREFAIVSLASSADQIDFKCERQGLDAGSALKLIDLTKRMLEVWLDQVGQTTPEAPQC